MERVRTKLRQGGSRWLLAGSLAVGVALPRVAFAAPAGTEAAPAGTEAPATPRPVVSAWRTDASLTGNYFSGNLDQAQLLGRIHVRTSGPRVGVDVLGSGFRVWSRVGDTPYQRVGDDLSGTVLPFLYVRPKVYLQGHAGYGSSLSRKVDGRVNVGASVGLTPVRTEHVLFRGSVGAQVERADYATNQFNADIGQPGTTHTVPRAVVASNGWYRVKGTPVSLRYLSWAMVDPLHLSDHRAYLDLGLDLRVREGWSTRLTVTAARDSVVPVGVSASEVRAGLGVAWVTPRAPTQE